MNVEQTEAIYKILTTVCQAPARQKADFIFYHVQEPHPHGGEWRFGGSLGSGGKFYTPTSNDRMYVNCYNSDETPERQATIQQANAQLAALLDLWKTTESFTGKPKPTLRFRKVRHVSDLEIKKAQKGSIRKNAGNRLARHSDGTKNPKVTRTPKHLP